MRILDRAPGPDDSVFWDADGKSLEYFASGRAADNIWRQPVTGGAPVRITDFRTDRLFFIAPLLGRRTLLLARGKEVRDLVLLTDVR